MLYGTPLDRIASCLGADFLHLTAIDLGRRLDIWTAAMRGRVVPEANFPEVVEIFCVSAYDISSSDG